MGPQYTEPVIVQHSRKLFYSATKTESESGKALRRRLRCLAAKCKFGVNYESVLLDKMVSCQNGRVFDRICEEDETLTLDKAMNIITRKEGS